MKRYTNFAFVCLFGISALVFACKSGDVLPSLPSDHYVLSQGTLFPTIAGINVVADTVNITICPPGYNCIAANSASASVRLIRDAETRRVRLFTYIEDGVSRRPSPAIIDSTGVMLGGQLYKVILKARYIKNKETGTTGQAILQVRRL